VTLLPSEKGLPALELGSLKAATIEFVRGLSGKALPDLFGVTDGKAVGTYVEAGLHKHVASRYTYATGNAATGIDFPGLAVDLKVTSIRQPQSSSPFRDASQKVYGLGYHLLLLVYEKLDDREKQTAALNFRYGVFIPQERTADFQTTNGIVGLLDRGGNVDDIDAFLEERNLPLDEIGRRQLAEKIMLERPQIGYLTVSNALQWRLQYGRVVQLIYTGRAEGLEDLLR